MANKQMIVLRAVVVVRDEKRIAPKIGQPFAFTDDELKEIKAVSERTKVQYLRKPVNETAGDEQDEGASADDNSTTSKPASKVAGRANKTAAKDDL